MHNLTIKFKLYGLAGLVVVCLAVLSIIALDSFSRIRTLNETLFLTQKSKTEMLTLRRNEKDFLARLDIKYQQKFDQNFELLMRDINKIKSLIHGREQKDQISDLARYLHAYHKAFNEIVSYHKKIGLNPESGLRGQLRKSVHAVEELLKETRSIQLTADMLMLRRNEKDFMLRKLDKYIDKFERNDAVFTRHLNASLLNDELKQHILSKMEIYHSKFIEFAQGYKQLGLTPKQGLQGKMRSTVHKTEEIFQSVSDQFLKNIVFESDAVFNKMASITLFFMIIIVGAVLSISHSINARLGKLYNYLSDVVLKSGDLSAKLNIQGQDEVTAISHLFNQFVGNLKETVSQIPTFSENLEKESRINTVVSEKTHQLAISQQTESDEIIKVVQQMISASDEITKNIRIAAVSAEEANESVLAGKQVIQEVSSSIDILATKLQSSADVTKDLEENSNNISTVLDVIRGIAEQTNLLALNAAIEAARAGEQGRGFAVVADEVRTLASRTQDSTTQIQSLIESFQENVQSTVNVMQEGSEGASSTAENASNAMNMLNKISATVNNIYELNSGIAGASEKQNIVSNTINKSIFNINQMAEETANQAREASQSSAKIKSIAFDLQSLISTYRF